MTRVHPPQIGPKTSLSLGSSNPETSLSGIDALEGNGRREAEGEGLVGVGVALACGRWPDQLRVVCQRLHSRVPSRLAQTRCDYAPARPARQGRKQTPSPHPTGCVSRRRDAREATPASQADVAAVDNGRAALPYPCRPLMPGDRDRVEARSSASLRRDMTNLEGSASRFASAPRCDLSGVIRLRANGAPRRRHT
jgi:hypothetical protein